MFVLSNFAIHSSFLSRQTTCLMVTKDISSEGKAAAEWRLIRILPKLRFSYSCHLYR